jgi:hypothetical protein
MPRISQAIEGSTRAGGPGGVPETLRVPGAQRATTPMAPLAPGGTARMLPFAATATETAPLARPLPVRTAPLAAPMGRRERITYEVYSPDDTLRGARALDAAALPREPPSRWVFLGALGLAVVLGTTLAAMGSCDDPRPPAQLRSP